jgi:hypothetical protein
MVMDLGVRHLWNITLSYILWNGSFIACDQPFDKVEKPEFITMMNYTHHGSSPLKILQCNTIKQCVIKMGKDTIEGVHEMFLVCYSPLNAFL